MLHRIFTRSERPDRATDDVQAQAAAELERAMLAVAPPAAVGPVQRSVRLPAAPRSATAKRAVARQAARRGLPRS